VPRSGTYFSENVPNFGTFQKMGWGYIEVIKINKDKLISLIVLLILSLSILIVISEKYIISHRYIYNENINTSSIKALKEKLNDSNFITNIKFIILDLIYIFL
jgi:hypothetical protein